MSHKITAVLTVTASALRHPHDERNPLWLLREHLKLTGTKFGGVVGQCGACTVHLTESRRSRVARTQGCVGRAHDDRRFVSDFQPSSAESVARRAGSAMRILPVGSDHAGSRSAQGNAPAEPRADRRLHEP